MLHIAICDDERVFVDHLKELLSQYILETGEEIKTSVFYDGLDLIEKYDPSFDLIFLDIQMKLVDGLRAAERIREKDESVGIIFLTTLAQYGLEGYKYAEDGQNEYGTAIIIQYMDGILNTIYPEEIAGMELAYPAKNWDER